MHNIAVGVRVSDILKNAPKHSGVDPQILVNGDKVHGNYKPKEDDVVHFTFVPGFTGAYAWLNWVIAFVASYAVSYALMPDIGDQQGGLGSDENKFERISGLKNKSPLYKPYQAILGKRKVAPVYISRPYTTVRGNREYFHALFSAGYGPLNLDNFRIGETAIADFDDVEIFVLDHYQNTDESVIREFWQQDISQQLVQIELREEEGWTNRTSGTDPETIVSNFLFPAGVYAVDDEGNNKQQSVEIRQDIQDEQGNWWTVLSPQYATSTNNIYPENRRVTRVEQDLYRWEDDVTQRGINGQLDQTFAATYGTNFSAIGNFETIEVDDYIFVKNMPENEKVASFTYTSASRTPKLRSLDIPRVDQIWGNQSQINIRTRKEGPTQAQVEEARGQATVQWENLQTVRPLTDEGFKEAIGYNRPLSRFDGNAVRTFRPTVIGIRMRATGQLNGNLDNLYCDATMVVPQDKEADWRNWPNLTLEPSTNPADAYKWLMQGPMNYSPIPLSKVDDNKLGDWRTRCNAENWSVSALLDYESTLLTELQNVAYVGRAEFQFNEGKFGVVEKIERTVPRQIFTPKNSANFQSKRVYPEVVDGVKFQFESALVDYEKDEGVFLDPAKDPDQGGDASLLKGRYTTNELWGVDNFDQAYRLTRFDYYERFLQREIYTLDLDAEVLASNRGDLVRVTNDIINVGLGAGRIKSIDGTVVTLDETINTDNLPANTGLQFRDDLGVITTTSANYLGDGQWDCASIDTNVKVGDLAIYGEADNEAIDCIIRSIKYNEDLGATLTLVNAANEIYSFDGNPVPTYDPSIAVPTDTTQPPAPIMSASARKGVISVLINSPDKTYPSKTYRGYIQARRFPLSANSPDDYFSDPDQDWEYIAQGDQAQFDFSISTLDRGYQYQIRSQFRSGGGAVSAWSNYEVVTLEYGENIPAINNLNYLHTYEGTYLTYSRVKDPEFSTYEVRLDTNFGEDDSNFVGDTKDNRFFLELLTTATTYYVAARNNFGEYGPSAEILVQPNVPNAPNNLLASQEGWSVRLTWDILNVGYAIDKYEVRYTPPPSDQLADSERVGYVNALTALYSTGTTGLYTFFVRTIDIAGNTSNYVSVQADVELTPESITDELEAIELRFDDLDVTRTDVNEILEEVSQDVIEVSERYGSVNAVIRRVDAINQDIEGAVSTVSVLEGQVNDPENNTSALYQQVQQAQTDADGNASSITEILSGVTGEGVEADALLKLESYFQEGGLGARAFFGTNVDNQITGVIVDDDGVERVIEFVSDSVRFIDGNGNLKIYYDTNAGRYIFDGEIIAQAGLFAGSLQAATGTFAGLVSGGSIDIGNGDFTVDANGNMVANSGTFGGSVRGADITIAENNDSGYFSYYDSTPFGSSGDLVEWYGEKVNGVTWNNSTNTPRPQGMSKINSKSYKTVNGSFYFGGTFQAGDLSISKQTTTAVGQMIVSTGTFSIPGGTTQINIAASVSATGGGQGSGTCPSSLPNYTSVVEIQVKSGSNWITVANNSTTTQATCLEESGNVIVGASGGSTTNTQDNVSVGQVFEYRAVASTIEYPTSVGGITVDGSRSLSIVITGD